MSDLILSIDIGTTNIKASLVNKEGTLLNVVRRPQNIIRKSSKSAEHCPKDLLDKVIECSKEAVEGRNNLVRLVLISAYQYGLVVLDQNMRPITNMSTLLDTRARATYSHFLEEFNIKEIYSTTGCPGFFQSPLPRLFYFQEKEPQILEKGAHFLSAKAWLLYNFTGQLITEASTESVSQFLNITTLKWSDSILSQIGLRADQMPEVVEPMDQAFPIRSEICKAIGLPDSCEILPGVYDGGAICFGMNAHQNARGVSNIGTSGMIRVLSDKLVMDDPDLMRIQPFYLYSGKYFIGGAINNAALPLKWFKENLLELDYDELDRLARHSPVGSNNLFFMPYLTGERDKRIGSICSGSFFGLREFHRRPDFIRAVLEGVAFNLNMIKESITASGLDFKEVHIGGGGVRRADIWVDILANVLDLRLIRSRNEEPCLVGNAIMGYSYLKEFSSLDEAGNCLSSHGAVIEPHPDIVDAYQECFGFFKEIYGTYESLYKKHAAFSRQNKMLCSYVQ